MKKTRLIPFDVEKAKNGAKVVTRCGYPVRIGLYDLKNKHTSIAAAVEICGTETPFPFTKEGKFHIDKGDDDFDLFIEEEVEETDDYNPYKETVKSISDMAERYPEEIDLQDFYDNVKVKCREAVEYDKKWCKKQEEQKISDSLKISPDKWYVCTHYISSDDADIWFKKDSKYLGTDILKSNLDLHEDDDYKNYFRPWDINDAKDGDILASKNGTIILIFKKCTCKCFVSYYNTGESLNIGWANDCFVPATKEQRELLFQKMKEEGYKWDSDKKKLKKIVPKFKVGDVMRTLEEANDDITEGLPVVISIDDDYYHCNNETIAIKDQDEYEYPPMNAKQKEVKKRRMTRQELSDWLRDCPEEHREWKYTSGSIAYSQDCYPDNEAFKPVEAKLIRRNHGKWQEPFIEE